MFYKIVFMVLFLILSARFGYFISNGAEFDYPWSEATEVGGESGLVGKFYQIALALVGVAAFGTMVYGGILYTISAGNSSKQQDAIGYLTSAALGVVLLLGAYLLLYTINPDLTNLTPPAIAPVKSELQEYPCVETEYIKCVETSEGKKEGVLQYGKICNGYTFSGKAACESKENCAWVLKEASSEIQNSPGWAESNGACQAK